jgi:hypothetical protein
MIPLLIGDSLAVGIAPYVTWDVNAAVGRTLMEGMPLIRASRRRVLAVSLGTNDPPTSVGALRTAVRVSLETNQCVIWATIYNRNVSYRAMNRALILERVRNPRRVRLVNWASVAAPYVAADPLGVHPTPAGYRLRARLYRGQAARCTQ